MKCWSTWLDRLSPKRLFIEDFLATINSHDFVDDPDFNSAYQAAADCLDSKPYRNRWRLYIALWCARQCYNVKGDFVECGVNYGTTAAAILQDSLPYASGKIFWLIDSFEGVDNSRFTDKEIAKGAVELGRQRKQSGFYNCSLSRCLENFQKWKHARIIKGWIPECLPGLDIGEVAFLHLDLNCVTPELQAFEYFRDHLSRSAMVLLDDYGYCGGGALRAEWKRYACINNLDILTLPTGQGLIMPNI